MGIQVRVQNAKRGLVVAGEKQRFETLSAIWISTMAMAPGTVMDVLR